MEEGSWYVAHVGMWCLNQYLREFDYRFNRREIDEERFGAVFGRVAGRLLTSYWRTPQPENPYA